MTEATVLIVLPCLNEERMLPSLLTQLIADGGGRRVIVADGGSSDRSCEIVQGFADIHPQVLLLHNAARIQSAGINLAVRTYGADCDWLVRIDAHCRYPRGYVRGLLATAMERNCESVVVPMVTQGETSFQCAIAAAQNSVLGTGGSPHRHVTDGRFVEHGHHAAMRLDLFCQVGGYDETLSHNEDAELDQRLLTAGARIWLEPSLAIVYFPRRDIVSLFRQYRGYGSGRARTAKRHRNRMALRQMLPMAIAPLIAMAAVGVLAYQLSPWFAVLGLPAACWFLACLAAGVVLALRQRSLFTVASGLAAATMHAGWSIGNWEARLFGPTPGPAPDPIDRATSVMHRSPTPTNDTIRH